MLFSTTQLAGVMLIEPEPRQDARGLFARTWCASEFAAQGLDTRIVQCSTSFSHARGTLRGMHYQAAPHAEEKLVRCTRGAIYDVVADLRPDSPTRYEWVAMVLSAENRRMLYIPAGCAHGFLTLEDQTEVFYQMSVAYHPESARGVRYDDPTLGIRWPEGRVRVVSERDLALPWINTSCGAIVPELPIAAPAGARV